MAEDTAIELVIDIDELTIGDLEKLEAPESTSGFIDLLQKAVKNTDIRKLPLGSIATIARAIKEEIKKESLGKN